MTNRRFSQSGFQEHFSRVEPGWTEKQLLGHAGEPDSRTDDWWSYRWDEGLGGMYVVFQFKISERKVDEIKEHGGCEDVL